jgi:ethanolamine utilization cobalamin adenosyltransferase
MTEQLKEHGGIIDDELRKKQDLLVKQKVTLTAEKEWLKIEKEGALIAATYAATIGQALTLSYEYQKSFKSIALDFKSSLTFVQNLVNTAQSAQGLASIADAATAMTELRKAGKSYYEDKALRTSILQLASATDISAGAAATMARQFKILGGTTEELRPRNVFTFSNNRILPPTR